MKKSELTFNAVLVPLDFLMMVLAGLTAYMIRFDTLAEIRPVVFDLPFGEYLNILFAVGGIWLAIFAMAGLYAIKRSQRVLDEIAKVFMACSVGIMIIIVMVFFKRELFSSRFIVLAGWLLSVVFVSFGRILVRHIQHLLYKSGIGIHRVVLVGEDRTAKSISRALHRKLSLGYKIVARSKDFNPSLAGKILDFKGGLGVDEIIQADPNLPREQTVRLIDFCNEHNIIFKYAADILGAKASNIFVDTIAGIPVVEIRKTPLEGWKRIIKRLVDICGSAIGLVVLSPLFLIVAAVVKMDSRGPVFARLERVGERGARFTLFKFRSMVDGAHRLKDDLMRYNERSGGPLFKMKKDPRITRVGRIIRRTSIDELPQLINVLAGSMSLVGPRPHEPEEVEKYGRHHKRLLDIKPGITGMAQVSGRSDLDFEEEARLDIYYIENWSVKLDLQILFKTPWIVLKDKSAC